MDIEQVREIIGRVNASCRNNKQITHIAYIDTELGFLIAAATEKGICMLEFPDYKSLDLELKQLVTALDAPLVEGESPYFDTLREELKQYFNRELREFDIPLDPVGTEFQKEVWLALLKIPYGATSTYAKQSELIGKPSAVRAVANANGKNKISIILPCHRVIGTDGSLTGYGGGLWRKKKLLELEQGVQTLL